MANEIRETEECADEAEKLAVQCHGVIKSYGAEEARIMALRGIELEVRMGEMMMLVGPSGCGKTTLISVIAGILDQDEGRCCVYDHDMLRMPSSEKIGYRARNVGFVFQAFNLLPALTAAENVAMPLIINGMKRKEAIDRAGEMLAKVGLGSRLRGLPAELSGGQQQRVAIARSLIHGPRLVVCDEPTSSLDHETGQKVMELLRNVALAQDRALVIVTHDARIFPFADRIARMDDGRIVRVVETNLDRLLVRAPVHSGILQVNIRPGEYAATGVLARPLVLLGDLERLHVRVDIDENDAWRFRANSPAMAALRGNRDFKANLAFVRVEPYVVPKRSLTGDSTERVDTRVLQAIYSFERAELQAYVGQQMDVFIEAPGVASATSGAGQTVGPGKETTVRKEARNDQS